MAKLAMLGDVGVGKSSLLLRFVDDTFAEHDERTLMLDLKIKTVELQGVRLRLHIWDTAGQERFRTITSSYYRRARGLVLVYDVSDRLSYEALPRWLDDVRRCTDDAAVLVLGNKTDLARAVGLEEAQGWARREGLLYAEASAKSGANVEQAFLRLVAEVHRRHQQVYHSSSLLAGRQRGQRRGRRC